MIKLDNDLNIIWDYTFGGDSTEGMFVSNAIYSSHYNMSIIPSFSASSKNGNKLSNNFGRLDYWIVGIDDNGTKILEISLGGLKDDIPYSVIETTNHTLKVIGFSSSGTTGTKTVPSKGLDDIWVVELDVNLSVEKIEVEVGISAYPVPTKTVLNYSVPFIRPNMKISLLNISGQVVYSENLANQSSGVIDVTGYTKGTYILKMNGDNFSYSRTVIIE